MTLKDLTEYAEGKYHIREEHRWAGYPGFSVLCDPVTGKWAALLMRSWDTDSGTEIQLCDIKCGQQLLGQAHKACFSLPFRMHGPKWLGVRVDRDTDRQEVFRLFDRAVSSGDARGYTVVLEGSPEGTGGWRDTPLSFAGRPARKPEEPMPTRIRLMRTLYTYDDGSVARTCRNFYLQGKFMQDYVDDLPWSGTFDRYFPTYHDLSVPQLRGYFTWRAHVREGDYQPIPVSVAYLYLYELLNGIGVSGPEEALEKMKAFEAGFLDAGYGDLTMRRNLQRWMLEYAVLKNLPEETVRACADADMLARDHAMRVLRQPGGYSDEEVFQALCAAGGSRTASSPVMRNHAEHGKHLFSEAWRCALIREAESRGRDLFSACFGRKSVFPWHPLSNTVCLDHGKPETMHYVLDECREYRCRAGTWYVEAYDRLTFSRKLFTGFLREADRMLRRYLRTGNYLKEREEEAWASPYIARVIGADREARREAARPKIVLDLSGLDRIRQDASVTRDSLLTEEELQAEEEERETESLPEEAHGPDAEPDLPLDPLQIRILRALLAGGDGSALIREHRLMPSVVADGINEGMFDEFGDTIVICDDDRLSLVEDYREDLEQLLGGTDG